MNDIKLELDEQDLSKLETDLNQKLPAAVETAAVEYLDYIEEAWKTSVFIDARKTGNFYESIHESPGAPYVDAREYALGSDVGYSGWNELGTRHFQGTHNLENAIEKADDVFFNRLDEEIEKI